MLTVSIESSQGLLDTRFDTAPRELR